MFYYFSPFTIKLFSIIFVPFAKLIPTVKSTKKNVNNLNWTIIITIIIADDNLSDSKKK